MLIVSKFSTNILFYNNENKVVGNSMNSRQGNVNEALTNYNNIKLAYEKYLPLLIIVYYKQVYRIPRAG